MGTSTEAGDDINTRNNNRSYYEYETKEYSFLAAGYDGEGGC